MFVTTIAFIVLVFWAASVNLLASGAYKHGTLAVYDTYGNVKHVFSGDFKHNTDGSFTCKNGTIYKFENMLFERM
jgi:hypothetical protein